MNWIEEVRGHRVGNHANPAATRMFEAGSLSIGLEYRVLPNDRGWCIHVYGMDDGAAHERLRIDAFERAPHYHLEWSRADHFIAAESQPDPWSWALDVLRRRLPDLAFDGGIDGVIAQLEVMRTAAASDHMG